MGRVARCRGARGARRDRGQPAPAEHAAVSGSATRACSTAGRTSPPIPSRFSRPSSATGAWLDRWLPTIVEAAAARRSRQAIRCSMSTCAATTSASATVAPCWSTGTGPRRRSRLSISWRGCQASPCEGGPQPWEVLPDGGAYAALVSGVWAAVVGLPPPETAPTVREIQRRQLEVSLAWCERELF